jgi:hypothetical protein
MWLTADKTKWSEAHASFIRHHTVATMASSPILIDE